MGAILTIVAMMVTAAGLVGTGAAMYLHHMMLKQQQAAKAGAYLNVLRKRASRLLLALEPLLLGDTPQETVLYQRFQASGGEFFDNSTADVVEHLRLSQAAWHDAFDLYQNLTASNVKKQRPLAQQIHDWEMLYATLVGYRGHNITAANLETLLNPLLNLKRSSQDKAKITAQLDALRRDESERPLQVTWQQIDRSQIDEQGILGRIAQVKAQITRLPARHRNEAARRLEQIESRRQALQATQPGLESEIPASIQFNLPTATQILSPLDHRLKQARQHFEQKAYLEVLEQVPDLALDLKVAQKLAAAEDPLRGYAANIETLTARGFRPPELADDLQEMKLDAQNIAVCIETNDYQGAATWLDELERDTLRALNHTRNWQILHQQNQVGLETLSASVARIRQFWATEAASAWQTLQSYPGANWRDIADEVGDAARLLHHLQTVQLEQIVRLNDLSDQNFVEAEQLIATTVGDLERIDACFQTVVHRLAQVQLAAAELPIALSITQSHLTHAAGLRDREDAKVDHAVDRQLAEAQQYLERAKQLVAAGEFLAAQQAHTTARKLTATAHAALQSQVREIDALENQLDTLATQIETDMDKCQSITKGLPATARTPQTNRLRWKLRQRSRAAEQLRLNVVGLEDRARAEALKVAIDAYAALQSLIDQTTRQLAADSRNYAQLVADVETVIDEAKTALGRAEKVVDRLGRKDAAWHALRKARVIMPTVKHQNDVSVTTLRRLLEEATSARGYARQAEGLALWELRRANLRSAPQPDEVSDNGGRWQRLRKRLIDDDDREQALLLSNS